jgi:hypothetical protein
MLLSFMTFNKIKKFNEKYIKLGGNNSGNFHARHKFEI